MENLASGLDLACERFADAMPYDREPADPLAVFGMPIGIAKGLPISGFALILAFDRRAFHLNGSNSLENVLEMVKEAMGHA